MPPTGIDGCEVERRTNNQTPRSPTLLFEEHELLEVREVDLPAHMYALPAHIPRAHRVEGVDQALDLVEQAGLGHLVSFGMHGFDSTSLPFLVDRTRGPFGWLRGHFARANGQWKRIDESDVFVLVTLADGYVSPAWYPSKAEHGRVVPTWNYEVVHIHGKAHIHDDIDWVRRLVTDLTDHHEANRKSLDGRPEWAITDAPDSFVDNQLRAIVGVEIEISLVEAQRKLSKNRPAQDQTGVIDGLEDSPRPGDQALADAMRPSQTRAP